ncbi:hypothetical protein K0G17_21460 [Bacteroides fragilis]|jgi:hypothetical protein|uniref:hypothetical protein n=1 Tax=Bacteroides fragilis TaxID=817 RepID=UPI0005157629|nr:hypothetical protein [Bacteroides fragilis]AKA53536.1 hypothetical protein VU15_18790 [Bacteroides fragilis]MCE8920373.1 hypothetical protein [Bacteroides fragilis]MCE9047286.1 hypothetical protein [Bacteroides fragilis]MCS2200156.1 hypothetical protein [Bacteroides fragilis]MCS2539111.1 hypothetical protein [Bacteroides fragilis]
MKTIEKRGSICPKRISAGPKGIVAIRASIDTIKAGMGVIRISTIVIRATIGAIKVSIGAIRAGIGVFKASAGAIRKNICDQGSLIIKYFHKQNLEKNRRSLPFKPKACWFKAKGRCWLKR